MKYVHNGMEVLSKFVHLCSSKNVYYMKCIAFCDGADH